MRRIAIFILLLLEALTVSAEPAETGTLLSSAKMDVVVDGKSAGYVLIPAKTHVTVVSTANDGYLVKRNSSEKPFFVPKESLSLDQNDTRSQKSQSGLEEGHSNFRSPIPLVVASASPHYSIPDIPSGTQSNSGTLSTGPTSNQVNQALGIPLFGYGNLWDENDSLVAGRLRWPAESKTSREAGYRRYPYTFNSETRVFGVRALSLFLQGIDDKVVRIAILFANKGDIAFYMSPEEVRQQSVHPDRPFIVTDSMLKRCRDAMIRDKFILEEKLTSLFGDGRPARVGRFAATTEAGQRWDWNGNTFLLIAPQNEYVTLKIIPTTAFEDANSEKKSFASAKVDLCHRIGHRDNGDVILNDIPMVDQGRKGYCVPATFERILRYYGLSGDMNILAMAGQTQPGGGTDIAKIQDASYAMLSDAGAHITHVNFNGSYLEIKPYIDAGKPVIFPLFSTMEFNDRVNERMSHRIAVTDWNEWREAFLPSLKKTEPLKPDPRYGHICLIVGYNASTGEIAISDSWGPGSTERWMTEEEARQIQAGSLSVIE